MPDQAWKQPWTTISQPSRFAPFPAISINLHQCHNFQDVSHAVKQIYIAHFNSSPVPEAADHPTWILVSESKLGPGAANSRDDLFPLSPEAKSSNFGKQGWEGRRSRVKTLSIGPFQYFLNTSWILPEFFRMLPMLPACLALSMPLWRGTWFLQQSAFQCCSLLLFLSQFSWPMALDLVPFRLTQLMKWRAAFSKPTRPLDGFLQRFVKSNNSFQGFWICRH